MKKYTVFWIAGGIFGTVFGILLGLVLSSCGTGTTYVVEGTPGAQGATGPTGASPDWYPVKLCPGTPSYPTTFVEYAFCVQGNLFATYSANGGFTTILPPGAYNSNAIGSSCAFTVISGCEISN